jgi:hypothetical protein
MNETEVIYEKYGLQSENRGQLNGHAIGENEIEEKFKPKSFRMTLDYEVKYPYPSLMIAGQSLIHPGEIVTLVASPGTGKTNISEIFMVAFLVSRFGLQDIDCLEIVARTPTKKALLIDTERTRDDCRTGMERIRKRLGNIPGCIENGEFSGVDFLSFSGLTTEECQQELDYFLENNQYGLVVIDGILDFANSLNDEKGCLEFVKNYLRVRAEKYELSVVVTIHPNKGTENIAGHLGAFLYRWSRAVLLLRNHGNGIREMTSDFTSGKLSKANNSVSQFYEWCEEKTMFVSANQPLPKPKNVFNQSVIETIFGNALMQGMYDVPAGLLKNEYSKQAGKEIKTTENHIRQAVIDGTISKHGFGRSTFYRLESYEITSSICSSFSSS